MLPRRPGIATGDEQFSERKVGNDEERISYCREGMGLGGGGAQPGGCSWFW